MKPKTFFLVLVTAALSFAAGSAFEHRHGQAAVLESRLLRETDARQSTGAWGSIRIYTPDRTPSVGCDSLLTAQLEFLPGKQLQPPHRHPDEEVEYVISGSGTWHLNGADLPLKPGDLLYAKPGDLHGIANTGAEPLKFLVVKWVSKGAEKSTP